MGGTPTHPSKPRQRTAPARAHRHPARCRPFWTCTTSLQNQRMPPQMPHADSRRRAEEALALRAKAYTWAEIGLMLNYRSREGARLAVRKLLASTRRPTVAEQRVESAEELRVQRRRLHDRQDVAEAEGDAETVIRAAREIRANLEAAARLDGLNAPARTEVSVTVSTVEDTRRRLLARLDRDTPALPVIDVEAQEVAQ
jgi:hypothetical protein